jgi:hypothetical protein
MTQEKLTIEKILKINKGLNDLSELLNEREYVKKVDFKEIQNILKIKKMILKEVELFEQTKNIIAKKYTVPYYQHQDGEVNEFGEPIKRYVGDIFDSKEKSDSYAKEIEQLLSQETEISQDAIPKLNLSKLFESGIPILLNTFSFLEDINQ